jgi:hypothetical protein
VPAVPPIHVAVVSRHPQIRLAAASAFDAAPSEWRVELYERAPAHADVVVLGPGESGSGVAFDPDRPSSVIADVERLVGRSGTRTITITSPSGGTGTTSVALHLAAAFARRLDTCVLEIDPRSGIGARLALDDDLPTWGAAEGDPSSLPSCAVPVAGGFRVMLAPPDASDRQPPIEALRGHWAILLVEAPAERLETALAITDAAVAILAPTIVGARRGRRLLDEHPGTTWAVVTNRLGPGGEITRSGLEQVLGRAIALELPCCAPLRDAEDEGRLLTALVFRWRRRIDRLARALAG